MSAVSVDDCGKIIGCFSSYASNEVFDPATNPKNTL